ncbi:uncharacterized protein [Diadema setosum]|uniref:uncharacterized protein n=1 Tax=Diadema setosum TaxID=31175 RepID=UPI003B3AB5A2
MAEGGATGDVGSDTGYSSTTKDQESSDQTHSQSLDFLSRPKSLVSHDGIATTVEVSDQDKSLSILKVSDDALMETPTEEFVKPVVTQGLQHEKTIKDLTKLNLNIGNAQASNLREAQREQREIIKSKTEAETYDEVLEKHKKSEASSIIQQSPTPATEKNQELDLSPGACSPGANESEPMRLTNAHRSSTQLTSTEKENIPDDLSHGILSWVVQCKDRKDNKTALRSPAFRTYGTDVTFQAKLYLQGYRKGQKTHFSLYITRAWYLASEKTVCYAKVQVLNHKDIGKTIEYERTLELYGDKNTIAIDELIEICKAMDENLGYSVNNMLVVIIIVKEITDLKGLAKASAAKNTNIEEN